VCGIFGLVGTGNADFARDLHGLFLQSESRGKEAAGLAAFDGNAITVLKEPQAASVLIRSQQYRAFIDDIVLSPAPRTIAVIGHSRLITNGRSAISANNQPAIKDSAVAVHNGIICNDAKIWNDHPELKRETELDTESFLALFESLRRKGQSETAALANAFQAIEGTASLAILLSDRPLLLLATNNGSLYICRTGKRFYFASERYILEKVIQAATGLESSACEAVASGNGVAVDLQTMISLPFEFRAPTPVNIKTAANTSPVVIRDMSRRKDPRFANLRRCTKCILPETMPFIDFDQHGVCNYCRTYVPHKPSGIDALRKLVEPHRSKSASPDCLVAISGGRDSCYGLHVLKHDLGLNPIAYTYDWGVITDLGRRNQARLCGKLGIEHILVSADIPRKREYVRRNIQAWLRRPALGMIPLFMAGDKQYFYFVNQIQAQTGTSLSFLCENKLERAHFKSGFMGVDEGHARAFDIGLYKKLAVLSYHARQYALNPRYINRSVLDTVFAFYSAYMIKHDNLQLFDYVPWDESEIISVLRGEYDWELATDTSSTWRIGDGTAAFYNYIYYNVAGFTENDAFRSNQIREGKMNRDQALALVTAENQPRWDSLQWYANTIGFSLDDALQVVAAMPRLWESDRRADDRRLDQPDNIAA
jgi:asparagine synthetase B (glutamine-hydrolysing)